MQLHMNPTTIKGYDCTNACQREYYNCNYFVFNFFFKENIIILCIFSSHIWYVVTNSTLINIFLKITLRENVITRAFDAFESVN